MYADQAHNYQPKAGVEEDWNVTMWQGFGTDYAYIHTGMHAYSYNGTTLTMAPLGSGVAEIVNPCIQAFMETKDYYDVCSKHLGLYGSCYRNAFFPAEDPAAVLRSRGRRRRTSSRGRARPATAHATRERRRGAHLRKRGLRAKKCVHRVNVQLKRQHDLETKPRSGIQYQEPNSSGCPSDVNLSMPPYPALL